jgi:hypothetical protein
MVAVAAGPSMVMRSMQNSKEARASATGTAPRSAVCAPRRLPVRAGVREHPAGDGRRRPHRGRRRRGGDDHMCATRDDHVCVYEWDTDSGQCS